MPMPIDPELQPLLAQLRAAGEPDYQRLQAPDMRKAYRESRLKLRGPAPEVAAFRDIAAEGPAGPIPVRLYRGGGTEPDAALPLLVFFHGGGWVVGDLDTHDVICRILANEAGCAVASVDYRLAPEHRFPAPVEDAAAATAWLAANAAALGLDGSRIAVGGDSAGGNLAAVLAHLSRDGALPPLAYQLLLYPAVDQRMAHPSYDRFTDGFALTARGVRWFRDQYIADATQREDWRASPLLCPSFAGLPGAFVLTVGLDPLVDEGRAYADALGAAGVAVEHLHVNDQMHGCLTMTGVMRAPARLLAIAGVALRSAFAPAP